MQVALQPGRSSSFEIVVGNGPKQTDPLQIYSKLASCVIPMIPSSSFVYLVAMRCVVSSAFEMSRHLCPLFHACELRVFVSAPTVQLEPFLTMPRLSSK